jgi:hypothetical protein
MGLLKGGGSPRGEPRRRLTGRVSLMRGAGPRTNTPERQGGASGENADKPSPPARRGRLQHPLEMPPRAGHGGIAIEVVLSHTSRSDPAAAAIVRTPAPYQRTVMKRRQALGRTAVQAGSIDGESVRLSARTPGRRACAFYQR